MDEKNPQTFGDASEQRVNNSAFKEFLSTIGVLVTALAVAFLLIAFVFQSYQVDGPSMENTLQNKDRLIVWKLPRTWARVTGHSYVPKRGDIIIFTQSGLSAYGQEDTKQLIKRVIGLPGDRVVVGGGTITVFNSAHPKGFQPDKTLPYGKNIPFTSGNVEYNIGSNELFVSGDNRPNSLDSRIFGPVKLDNVIGKLAVRIYPLNTAEKF